MKDGALESRKERDRADHDSCGDQHQRRIAAEPVVPKSKERRIR